MVGVFIDKIESKDYGIKLFSEVGKTFPLHCTSLGKVLLAWGPSDTTQALLAGPLEPATENTIIEPDRLLEELEGVRRQGYAVDHEEITRGIMCVAAPVFGVVEGDAVCAISVTFPSYIYHDRGIEPEIEAVRRQAADLSGEFKKQCETPSIPSSAQEKRLTV
jgi:DNA-binding IclR family transcriptional regulator